MKRFDILLLVAVALVLAKALKHERNLHAHYDAFTRRP